MSETPAATIEVVSINRDQAWAVVVEGRRVVVVPHRDAALLIAEELKDLRGADPGR